MVLRHAMGACALLSVLITIRHNPNIIVSDDRYRMLIWHQASLFLCRGGQGSQVIWYKNGYVRKRMTDDG